MPGVNFILAAIRDFSLRNADFSWFVMNFLSESRDQSIFEEKVGLSAFSQAFLTREFIFSFEHELLSPWTRFIAGAASVAANLFGGCKELWWL